MSRRKGKSKRKETRRQRVTRILVLCVAIYVMCFFPAWRWSDRPQIAMFMAVVFTVLTTAKCKSIRVGFRRGLIFGVLSGLAVWAGVDYAIGQNVAKCNAIINFDFDVYLTEVEEKKAEARKAHEEGKLSDEKLAEIEAYNPTREDAPSDADRIEAKKMLERLTPWRKKVPYYTVPPTIVVCSCIGLFFGVRAQQRRKQVEHEWHTI